MALINCPESSTEVSSSAFKCPKCGVQLRKLKRGFFGTLFVLQLFAIVLTMLTMSVVYAAKVKQYASIPEMIEDFNDYDDKSFKMLATQPIPHLQLSPPLFSNDHKDVIEETVQRAAIYGIYRTFIHTANKQVKVTSIPSDPKLKKYAVTLQVNRDQVVEIAKQLFGVNSLDELVRPLSPKSDIPVWTDTFNHGYYNDQGPPTLRKHFAMLMEASQQPKKTEKVQDKQEKQEKKESKFSCAGGKQKCGQMISCEEAYFYLNKCGVSELDKNKDGIPCESICGD